MAVYARAWERVNLHIILFSNTNFLFHTFFFQPLSPWLGLFDFFRTLQCTHAITRRKTILTDHLPGGWWEARAGKVEIAKKKLTQKTQNYWELRWKEISWKLGSFSDLFTHDVLFTLLLDISRGRLSCSRHDVKINTGQAYSLCFDSSVCDFWAPPSIRSFLWGAPLQQQQTGAHTSQLEKKKKRIFPFHHQTKWKEPMKIISHRRRRTQKKKQKENTTTRCEEK